MLKLVLYKMVQLYNQLKIYKNLLIGSYKIYEETIKKNYIINEKIFRKGGYGG